MKNISEKALLIVLIVLVVVFGIYLSDQSARRIDDVSNQVNNLSDTVNSQNQRISSLYSQIENLLNRQASIIDSYNISYGAINNDDMTYEVSLTVTPKEFKENTTASFTLGDLGGDMSRTGTAFSALINVPVKAQYHPIVTFNEDGKSRSETLSDEISFQQNYVYQIKCTFTGSISYQDKQMHYDGNILAFYMPPEGFTPESERILAIVNNTEIFTKDISLESQTEKKIEFNETFPVNNGDTLALFIEVSDNSGLTYRFPVDSTFISPDGHSQSEHYIPDQCIVYDKNGNEIKFK
ncbi:MAG: hypothetical protein ACERKO_11210 [Acetanaerobacterium sp.]